MKTSNKLLLTIAVLTIGAIVTFDLALRAEYLKGDYKKPFYNMTAIPIKDFDAIEDFTDHETYLEIEKSNHFEIWIGKDANKDLAFTLQNRVLKINFKSAHGDQPRQHVIHIKCPQLLSLKSAVRNGDDILSSWGSITISGFQQDSMSISKRSPGTIFFGANFLKKLNLFMNSGEIDMGGNSTIDTGNFQMVGKTKLNIDDMLIPNKNYKLDDSVQVTLKGKALTQIAH